MTRRLAALAAAAIATLTVTLGASAAGAVASTGSYTITTCSPGATAGSWTQIDQLPASMAAGNECGGGTPAIGPDNTLTETGSLYGEDTIGSLTSVPTGDSSGWQLTVPTGLSISSISYYGSFETDANGWLAGLTTDGSPLANVCQTNISQADCDCITNSNNPSPCQVLNSQAAQTVSDLSASSLFFGVQCSQVDNLPTCGAGSTQHAAEADLYSAQVTLTESASPQVSSEGGELWGSGPVWGTVPVTFTASDLSGIAAIAVDDSQSTDIASTAETCEYTLIQACPELPGGQLDVNTALMPDGPQRVTLAVTDAAGNTTSVQGPLVVVDNHGPPPPRRLTATAVTGYSNEIALRFTAVAGAPEPVAAAFAELCQDTCGAPRAVSDRGTATLTAPRAGRYAVRVWETDTAGRGSSSNAAAASVTVPCKPTARCPFFSVTQARWSGGHLAVRVAHLPRGDRLKLTLRFPGRRSRIVYSSRTTVRINTTRPSSVVLRALRSGRQQGTAVTITKSILLPD